MASSSELLNAFFPEGVAAIPCRKLALQKRREHRFRRQAEPPAFLGEPGHRTGRQGRLPKLQALESEVVEQLDESRAKKPQLFRG